MIALICKSVKIAGGKSAETSVAETCVGLAVIKLFELYAEGRKRFLCGVGHVEIIECIFKASAHEKFHAEIINLLLTLFF